MKLWNWWINTTIGDYIWHRTFHLRHCFECRFTTRYDLHRHGDWVYRWGTK